MIETGAIISAFKWLAPYAIDLLKKHYSFIGEDADEKLQDLENFIIPRMEMLIEAAKENERKYSLLRRSLKSLEEAVYEAEEVLDLHDYYRLEQEAKSSAEGIMVCLEFLLSLIKDLLFSVELKKSLMKLENFATKAKEFLPSLPTGISNVRGSQTANESDQRVTTTAQLPHKVFGRKKQRDDIVHLLHETAGFEPESSSAKGYSVVAIVGVGGAGKTTLVQYVCDYEREEKSNHFDVIMWVHVSQILNVEKLTREMVESASGEACPRIENLDTLQRKLKGFLESKKFLLVLDDVWSENEVAEQQWATLLGPLQVGNRGSKILMTTRERRVAEALRAKNILGLKKLDILDLKELEESDLLSLFMHFAFPQNHDNKLYEELEEIVRKNIPKLHGSPLAARMVGSQLRQTPPAEWKRILSGDLLEGTMECLLWSYQNLDAPLQRCFSYCSLFSKGQKIQRKKLIHLWVAEGFIKTVDESTRIFDELLSRSFFQPTKDDDLYTIHNLLHDLAQMVSKDRCHRVEGNPTEAVVPPEIRHLSIRIDHHRFLPIDSGLVEKICNLKNLRTLIFLTWTNDYYFTDDLMHNIFVKLKKLRVVDLGEFRLGKLPESIGGLKHLRYLDLHKSSFASLPKSIYALYHLEFLNIYKGTLVAKNLANWINLQHLYFSYMILNLAGLGCLKQLENLRNVLGYSIHINGLENVKEKGESPVEIKGVKELCLEWSTTDNISRSSDMDAQVLEGLRPPPHLRRLKIVGYQGCLLPSWMVGDRHLLHNLISLELVECRQLKQLLIISPTLKLLQLSACSLPIVSKEDLPIIKSSKDVRISQVVTFMEGLVATYGSRIVSAIEWDLRRRYDSQKLRNWLEKAVGIVYQNPQGEEEEEEQQLVLPPALESLYIRSCPLTDSTLWEGLRGLTSLKSLNLSNIVSLTSLPSADVLGRLTMLEELHIKQCWFLTSLAGLQALGSLRNLFMSFCPSLSAEGGSTSILPSSLQRLKIEACDWKQYLDPTSAIDAEGSNINPFVASLQLGNLELLWKLSITDCPNIGSLLGLQELNHLIDLTLTGCPKLAHAETKLGSLLIRSFSTDAPSLLYVLLTEEALASLLRLEIMKFKEESFRSEEEQVFQHLTSLDYLFFYECSSIKSLPNSLESLSSLKELAIFDCPNITSLPDLPTSLILFFLQPCNPVLKRRCQRPHGEDWCKISHIPRIKLDGVDLI